MFIPAINSDVTEKKGYNRSGTAVDWTDMVLAANEKDESECNPQNFDILTDHPARDDSLRISLSRLAMGTSQSGVPLPDHWRPNPGLQFFPLVSSRVLSALLLCLRKSGAGNIREICCIVESGRHVHCFDSCRSRRGIDNIQGQRPSNP